MLESFKLAFNEAFPQWLYDIIMSETFDSVLCLSALIYVFGGIILFGELYEYITKRMVIVATSAWAFAFFLYGLKGYFITDSLWMIPVGVVVPLFFIHFILGCYAYTYYEYYVEK